ncbi:MAG TPA: serine protease [Actinocrinis sp.]
MADHRHSEDPWRVRVDDQEGRTLGAGVLLDDRHMLTCAHVVTDADAAPDGRQSRVLVSSSVCHPEWTIPARLSDSSWVYQNGTRRGDVALLELDAPTPCGASTRLWRAPISGGLMRAYGFPSHEDKYGIAVTAQLAGAGGREGEWGVLNRVDVGAPWIEPGYSGAGVLALDGEFKGRVIGIVVRDYVVRKADDVNNEGARAGWILPTETMLSYLPQLEPYVDGEWASRMPKEDYTPPDHGLDDPLRLALTQELTRLLSGRWTGTVVLTGGATGTGTSWLERLLQTADPAVRPRASDAELSRAPQDTVLAFGAVDAAYNARDRSLTEIRHYLADRLGFPADERDVLQRLLHRRPPVCLVVASVDRAADPDALVEALLGPLARRAWSRGIRLVLGFDGQPPPGLSYEVSLGPEPAGRGLIAAPAPDSDAASALAGRAEAEGHVARLSAAEDAAGRLHAELGLQYYESPPLPRRLAPQLRVQLAVAHRTEPNAEFGAIRDQAAAALGAVEKFDRSIRRLPATREDLRAMLSVHRVRAQRYFGAEDAGLLPFYDVAVKALSTSPIDLTAARDAVQRYADEVDRRIREAAATQDSDDRAEAAEPADIAEPADTDEEDPR